MTERDMAAPTMMPGRRADDDRAEDSRASGPSGPRTIGVGRGQPMTRAASWARAVTGGHEAAATFRGRWIRPIVVGFTILGLLLALANVYIRTRDGFAWDARAYWSADLSNLYATARVTPDFAYLYSPAFAQAISPLTALPWALFLPLWTGAEAIALVILAGPFTLPLLFLEPVLYELDVANVTLLLALAIVAGFRYPWTWALVLLTKVTPGVGLLWFAFRREWRSLGIALGATAVITLVSFVLSPGQWVTWVQVLLIHDPTPGFGPPLWVRLPLSVVLLWWGARTNRRWVVPIAAMLALPVLRTTGLVLLVACLPLARVAEDVNTGSCGTPSEAS